MEYQLNQMPEQPAEQNNNKKDHKFFKGALCGALITLAVIGVFGMAAFGVRRIFSRVTGLPSTSGSDAVVGSNVEQKLELIRAIMDHYYLNDIDDKELEDGLYSGYVSALGDPYSVYYNEEETKALNESIEGIYSGVGAVMSQDQESGVITFVNVYKDAPADLAGVKDGDILNEVDGRSVDGEDLSEVVTWIKGEEGTEVNLGVYRQVKGDVQELELTAVRAKVEAHTVEYEMKEDQLGYISVSEFDTVTLEQFQAAINDLESQGMKGLVVDLRSNPGGNLSTVCDMLRLVTPKGTLVYTEDKNGERTDYTNDEDHTFEHPMVVLVNGYSASASEIFTGAVQDYGVATVVGTTTYGKGVVQQTLDLQDGTSMKITISEYFTPKGRVINEKGITPDVEVEYEADEENPDADNQLDRALEILREEQK